MTTVSRTNYHSPFTIFFPPRKLCNSLIDVVTFLVVAIIYGLFALYQFDHNDFMYSSAAHRSGMLYQDNHYIQAPLGYYFFHMVALLSPLGWSYPIMRFISTSLMLATIAVLAGRFLESRLMRCAFYLLVCTSSNLLGIGGEIGTYTLALFFVSLGYAALFTRWPTYSRYGIAGLFIGLAASTKLYHLVLGVPILWLIWTDRTNSGLFRPALAAAIGGCLGTVLIFVFFLSEPMAFMLHNFIYHTQMMVPARDGGWLYNLRAVPYELSKFGLFHFAALIGAIWYFIFHLKNRPRCLTFLLLAVLTAVVMSMTPLKIYPQYLAPASILIFLLYCCVAERVESGYRGLYFAPIILVAMVGARNNFDWLASAIKTTTPPVIQVVSINKALAEFRAAHKLCDDGIFSLEGGLAIDSGFKLTQYTEAGEFWQFVNGYVPEIFFTNAAYHLPRDLIEPAKWVVASRVPFWLIGYYQQSQTETDLRQAAHRLGYETIHIGKLNIGNLNLTKFEDHPIDLIYDPRCAIPGAPNAS